MGDSDTMSDTSTPPFSCNSESESETKKGCYWNQQEHDDHTTSLQFGETQRKGGSPWGSSSRV